MTLTRREHYVFDTNTLVSAALFASSVPRHAFDLARVTGVLLISASTIHELVTVLLRPKFDRYLTRAKRERFLAEVSQQAQLVAVSGQVVACRDPKDDMFLDLAVHGAAVAIITGDADLLVLHPFRTIPILTPQQFVAQHP